MADNQNNVLVPNQQYRNQIETYGIGNPTSLPLLVEALRQYVLTLPIEPDKGLAEKVAALEASMSQAQEDISSIEGEIGGINSSLTSAESRIETLETDAGNLENDVGTVGDLATSAKTVVPAINEVFNLSNRLKAVWQERTASTDFFIHPSVPRILLGVYTSDGAISYYGLDWSKITASFSNLTEIKMGNVSVTVQAALMSEGRYKINVANNPSASRGVALVIFDQGYIE